MGGGGEGEIMRCVFRTLSRFMYVFMGFRNASLGFTSPSFVL